MAGKLPLFASAPRAKIRIAGRDVAYAIGLSLSASVNLQEIRILGEFAVQSIEPVAYLPVSGSFQVVRLLSNDSQETLKTAAAAKHANNQLLGVSGTDADLSDTAALENSVPNPPGDANDFGQSELYKQLDPRTVLSTGSFDVEVNLKVPVGDLSIDGTTGISSITPPAGVSAPDTLVSFMEIKDCRLINASANIAPNQLLTQSLEFQGLLMINKARGGVEESLDTSVREGIEG